MEVTVTHKMADGTIRDSIDGYEIPYNDSTEIVYALMLKQARQERLE